MSQNQVEMVQEEIRLRNEIVNYEFSNGIR